MINCKGRKKSLQEALAISPSNQIGIIHEEITNKGSIVFISNTNNTEKYLCTAFVSKNLFGYKDLYSGFSSIDRLGKMDLTAQFFPSIKKTPLPIYFGVILNDKIAEVKVKENRENSSEWKTAKIIEAGDMRIWLMYMNGFKGSEFEIVGYDNDGSEISRVIDTTPWVAEQKPQKSPYE